MVEEGLLDGIDMGSWEKRPQGMDLLYSVSGLGGAGEENGLTRELGEVGSPH